MKTKLLLLPALALTLTAGAQQSPAPIYTPSQSSNSSQQPIGSETNQSQPGTIGGILRAITGEQDTSNISLDQLTRNWVAPAREAAQQMYQRYGSPQEFSTDRLVWRNNGGWKSTEVINQEIQHNFPTPHTDVLRQSIAMNVPPEKIGELAQFSGSIIVDRTKGEISARCDNEANNTIALNLANDIVSGRLTPDQARSRFTELTQAVQQGQRPAYATGFQFSVTSADTAFPDGQGTEQRKPWQRIGW